MNLTVLYCKITINVRIDLLQIFTVYNIQKFSVNQLTLFFTVAFLQTFTIKIIIILFYSGKLRLNS